MAEPELKSGFLTPERGQSIQCHQAFIRDIDHLPLNSVGGSKVKAFCFFPNKEHVGEHIPLPLAGW